MDQLLRAWYGREVDVALLKKKEQEYENFFSLVMSKAVGPDFLPVKAAGSDGDGKCDGRFGESGEFFQVYAPSSAFRKQKLIEKISDDFEGAKSAWGERLKKWTFVHNDYEGLPPYAIDVVDELRAANGGISISVWGPETLKEKALSLSHMQLVDIFGPAPSMSDFKGLTHEEVKTLLRAIGAAKVVRGRQIQPVSLHKLEFNRLSDDTNLMLSVGRQKEYLVEDILGRWLDPLYGERLAQAFGDRYRELSESGLNADAIFGELLLFAGGCDGVPANQVAALAVLSFFFERCEIFENAPKEWVGDIAI